MEKTNLDIWTIQGNPEEINLAVENIKDSDNNIMFRNCITRVIIGSKRLKSTFDTVFYSEESDILIMLMKNCLISAYKLKELLDKKKIKYHEVSFYPFNLRKRDNEKKEIWFAREKCVLEEAIENSIKKDITLCRYYPNLIGNIDFSYFIGKYHMKSFDSLDIKGVVELEDKLILFISNGYSKNITQREALETLANNNITTIIDDSDELVDEKEKVYLK